MNNSIAAKTLWVLSDSRSWTCGGKVGMTLGWMVGVMLEVDLNTFSLDPDDLWQLLCLGGGLSQLNLSLNPEM